MHAVVVGGDSGLGMALRAVLSQRGHTVVWTTRRSIIGAKLIGAFERVAYLDMLAPRLPVLDDEGAPVVVYIMAAIAGVVPAERDDDAWRINAEAPVALAMQAKARGWHVVQMSSGTVELAPHSASALQKSYADLAVTMLGGCVVRPLPRVPLHRFTEVANLLTDVGEQRWVGTVRWEG